MRAHAASPPSRSGRRHPPPGSAGDHRPGAARDGRGDRSGSAGEPDTCGQRHATSLDLGVAEPRQRAAVRADRDPGARPARARRAQPGSARRGHPCAAGGGAARPLRPRLPTGEARGRQRPPARARTVDARPGHRPAAAPVAEWTGHRLLRRSDQAPDPRQRQWNRSGGEDHVRARVHARAAGQDIQARLAAALRGR